MSHAEFTTMVELLRHRATNSPDVWAFSYLIDGEDNERRWTYGELDRRSRAVAATVQAKVDRGARILVLFPQGLDYLAALFGTMYAATLGIPLQPPDPNRLDRTLPKLEAITTDGGVSLVLATRAICDGASRMLPAESPLSQVPWIAVDEIDDACAEDWVDPHVAASDLAYLQYTSGSTSTPKGVMVSHQNLLHNLFDFDVDYGHDESSLMVTWLPTFHDLGLVYGIFMPLYKGFPAVILDPMAFLARPIRWLRAISTYRGTHSPAPNFAYDICVAKTKPEDREGLDLSCWKVALNGAEPIRYESEQRFVETYAENGVTWKTISHAYGMSETTAKICSEPHWWDPEFAVVDGDELEANRVVEVPRGTEGARIIASCGTTDTDTEVVIANPEGFAQLPDARVGEIWVGGTTITHGYWNREDATTENYGAVLSDTGAGPYFRTGDLGFTREGRVYVTGRLKDMIIIRGENHYPQDIEWDVQFRHPSLRPNSIAAFSVALDGVEQVAIVAEVYADKITSEEEVFAVIRETVAEHGIQVHAIQLIAPRSIFKTSSGKIMRGRIRRAFETGEFTVVAEWRLQRQQAPVAEKPPEVLGSLAAASDADRLDIMVASVVRVAATILGLPEDYVERDRPLRELGFDSVQAVELAEEVGNAIGQTLPATLLFDYPTCEELARYIVDEALVENKGPEPASSSQNEETQRPVTEMSDEELEAALLAELGEL